MTTLLASVRRHPLVAFFVLAYAFTWWVYPFLRVSPLLGFPGLLGPALAAIVVVAVTDGKAGLKDLLGRLTRWRVGARWYAVALGLPAVLAATAAGISVLFGASGQFQVGRLSVLEPILFVLVVGEELGWRGYALPRLLATRSALSGSLVLGVIWGFWHLPTFFIPGTPQYGQPFAAYVLLTVAYSVVFTWLYLRTWGSVLIATLLHGAINLWQGIFLANVDPDWTYWLLALVYGSTALVLVIATGRNLSRHPLDREKMPDGAGL